MSGVIKSEMLLDNDGVMHHRTSQPTEDLILARNADLRNNPGVIQDLGAQSGDTWGRQVASIPEIVFWKAIRDGYQMTAKDSEFAEKELFRFLRSEEGKKCLVGNRI
jgi:hypothetical protein